MRKQRLDSVSGKIAAIDGQKRTYSVPSDLEPLTTSERAAWEAHICARDEWGEADLHILHTLVRLQSSYNAALNRWIQARDADDWDHPSRRAADQTLKALQAQYRLLGLNKQASATRDPSAGIAGTRKPYGFLHDE